MKKKYITIMVILFISFVTLTLIFSLSKENEGTLNVLNIKGSSLPSYQHYIDIKLDSNTSPSDFINNYNLILDEPGYDVSFPAPKKALITNSNVRIYLPVLQDYNNYKITFRKQFFKLNSNSISAPLVDKAEDCFAYKEKVHNCMNRYFHNKVNLEDGVENSLNELNSLVASDGTLSVTCHSWAHAIGEASAWLYKDWERSMQYSNNICSFGYYHGVQESLAGMLSNEELAKTISGYCKVFNTDVDVSECAHGLGHMLYWRSGGDFNLSSKLCSSVAIINGTDYNEISKTMLSSCSSGVAMSYGVEYEKQYVLLGKTPYSTPDTKNPFMLCGTIENKYVRAGCYITIHFSNTQSRVTMQKVGDQCLTLKDPLALSYCLTGYAKDYGRYLDVPYTEILDKCLSSSDKEAVWNCSQGLAYIRTMYTGKIGTVIQICKYLESQKFDKNQFDTNCNQLKSSEETWLSLSKLPKNITTSNVDGITS